MGQVMIADLTSPQLIKVPSQSIADPGQLAGEDDEGTAILSDIVRNREQFDLLVAVVRMLISTNQPRDAREVIGGILKLISSCGWPHLMPVDVVLQA
jgi:hypothetical protein